MKKRARRRSGILLGLALAVTAIVVLVLRSTAWLASLGGRLSDARLERAQRSPNFADGKFRNAEATRLLSSSLLEQARRTFGKEQRAPLGTVPVVVRTARDYQTPPAGGLRATWIGWASVLVEIDGHVVLTDPIWSDRCSPSTLVGPRRFHQPPIALTDLPRVDLVVISHDHYDHLDMPAVKALAARGTHFAVPLGVGAHLERWAVPAAQIHDLDWNESFTLGRLTVTATPARHYSGRNPLHNKETLWASWVIRGDRHRVYFSGDTGYTAAFKRIGAEHGPFDLTLIKIGASDPTWEEIHMDPEDAIRAHVDLGGRVMLPIHWATFNLGFHAWRDPIDRAVAAAQQLGVTLTVPRPGEFVDPAATASPQTAWWVAAAGG